MLTLATCLLWTSIAFNVTISIWIFYQARKAFILMKILQGISARCIAASAEHQLLPFMSLIGPAIIRVLPIETNQED